MPQKKTRKYYQKKQKHIAKQKNNNNTRQFKSIFERTPTPYPYSNNSSIYSYSPASVAPQVYSSSSYPSYPSYPSNSNDIISSSSAYVKAVSNDGKHWHVDTDINGVKDHNNLTKSQIMELLSYPASKQNLRSQLLHELRNIPRLPLQAPLIKQNFGIPNIPIIEMYQSHEEPRIRYIYKKGCSPQPMMMNNLSPLREASIITDSDEPPIHLIPMKRRSSSRGSSSSISPKKYKNKTKSKKQKERKK